MDCRATRCLAAPTQSRCDWRRGITTDVEFEAWANRVWFYPTIGESGGVGLKDFRKPMQIELYNELGRLLVRYNLYNCWPSEYIALPDPAGDGKTVAIQSMTIEHEGCELDTAAPPP